MKYIRTAILNVVCGFIGMAIWLTINYFVVTNTASRVIILSCRIFAAGVIVLIVIMQNTKRLRKNSVESPAKVFFSYLFNICIAIVGAYGCGFIFQNFIMNKL